MQFLPLHCSIIQSKTVLFKDYFSSMNMSYANGWQRIIKYRTHLCNILFLELNYFLLLLITQILVAVGIASGQSL